jgi:cell division protein FtsW (lipid II flippase)
VEKHILIGLISGLITSLSIVPYAWRIWQRKTQPVTTTWVLLSFLGLAFLLTYNDSGAEANIWPAVAGFVNPVVVVVLSWMRGGKRKKLSNYEWLSIAFCGLALEMWFLMRLNKDYAQFALYLAIVADALALLPTVVDYYKDPTKDRPGAWLMFAIGYGIGMFAIVENTWANYSLPIYIVLAHLIIVFPLIRLRLRKGTLRKEWI